MKPIGFLLGMMLFAPAQEVDETGPKADVEFSIKHVRTQPGQKVILPLVVTAAVELTNPLRMEVSYPGEKLVFEEFKPGLLVGKSGWNIQIRTVTAEQPDGPAGLQIEMTPNEPVFFPSGVIGYATFQVPEEQEPGEIVLNAALDVKSRVDLKLSAPPGRIQVLAEAVYGCFFYMH